MAQLIRLCGWLALPYGLSVLTLTVAGIQTPKPWTYLLPFAGIAVPYAYCLSRLLLALADPAQRRRPTTAAALGMCTGMVALAALPELGHGHLAVLAVFYALLAFDVRRLPPGYFRRLSGALVALVLGLGTVCNLNYLLAPEVAGRLHDPALARLDVALYHLLLDHAGDYRGIFPLVSTRTAFRLLENAYHLVFAELFVVVLVSLRTGADPSRFLRAVFLAYFAGLIMFAIYPAVGPCIYYPETFRPEFEHTATHYLMRKLETEFATATAGRPVNGLAYFVAIPSLHAALATLCQCFLRRPRFLFWTALPINTAVVLSTVLLGYHYVVDVPLGVLLGLAAAHVVGRPLAQRRPIARPPLLPRWGAAT